MSDLHIQHYKLCGVWGMDCHVATLLAETVASLCQRSEAIHPASYAVPKHRLPQPMISQRWSHRLRKDRVLYRARELAALLFAEVSIKGHRDTAHHQVALI